YGNVETFVELMTICPSPIGYIFSDYVLSNYIEPDALFPLNLWASKPTLSPRTTNGAESFHRTYNTQFHNTHPPIHLVISILKETQAETETIISSINKGREKSVAKKDLDRINLTIQMSLNIYHWEGVRGYSRQVTGKTDTSGGTITSII
ncbi:uncharacterized protein LOC132919039, partial [Rhopalosiphum padi]|uniref:uncharacterized protein LOC132919039 n=1 Tax=Rhopalosiphum padi TaxID=40932 RepID=UPI00298E8009